MDAALITRFYFVLVIIALVSQIRNFIKASPKTNENYKRARTKFLLGFFSYTALDQIIIPYIQVSYRIYDFSRIQISHLQLINQIFSIIGSLVVVFFMHHFNHYVLISFICAVRSVAAFLLMNSSYQYVLISTILNGFSLMFAKICFDDWVIEIYGQYNLNQNEIAAVVNSRSTTQFVLDLILSSSVSFAFKEYGLKPVLLLDCVGFFIAVFIPFFVMKNTAFPPISSESNEPKEKIKKEKEGSEEEEDKKQKETSEKGFFETLFENPQIILYFFVDTSYCFVSNIIKAFITVPYKSKNLPFSQILASYNCCILIGTTSSLFLTKYISIGSCIHLALFIFIIASILYFSAYHIELIAHCTTLLFGFADGFFMPLTNCKRKEIYPTKIRPFLLSSQRLLGSLIATQAVRFIAAHSDNYLGLSLLISFSISYISYLIMCYLKARAKKMD